MADRDNPDFFPDFLSAGTIKGDRVVNRDGDNLGKIEELMIDLQDGRVAYAAVSFGGFLGLGDKSFSIPWRALSLRPLSTLSPLIFPGMSWKTHRALIRTNGL